MTASFMSSTPAEHGPETRRGRALFLPRRRLEISRTAEQRNPGSPGCPVGLEVAPLSLPRGRPFSQWDCLYVAFGVGMLIVMAALL